MDVDEFAFTTALEDVFIHELRSEATWSHRDTRREWQSPLPCLFVDNGENFLLIIHNGCKVGELFGNNGFYSLNNLKGLAIFVFFCIFVAQNVQ